MRAEAVLAALSMVMWAWMMATRLPAMKRAGLDPQAAARTADLHAKLPSSVMRVSDNYNHLFEAPTVFYAVATMLVITGAADSSAVVAAWSYVGLRIAHSLVQASGRPVVLRFALFSLSQFALLVLTVLAAWVLFAGGRPS